MANDNSSGTLPSGWSRTPGRKRIDVAPPRVLAIGASTGGPAALPIVLSGLPADYPLPVLVVQHMPPVFTTSLADALDRRVPLNVLEGTGGALVERGKVFIAPGGRHMKVKRAGDGAVRLVVTDEPPVNHCRPSVDVLLDSVAEVFGGRVLAAILTGMGNDGARGFAALKLLGAQTFAQDEATCTVFGMPREAIRAGAVDLVLPLHRLAHAFIKAARPHAATGR